MVIGRIRMEWSTPYHKQLLQTTTVLNHPTSRKVYSHKQHRVSVACTEFRRPTSRQDDLDFQIYNRLRLVAAGTSRLRPIQWRVWAGKIEREGEAGFTNSSGEVERDYVGNPFRLLESRPGFVDIRKQKKEFAGWVKDQ
ncbi:magnesium transporter [Xylariomycetidae sp. FL2044]|nr:magnesium transporter [Xylariomycetidae sp. FL2044]